MAGKAYTMEQRIGRASSASFPSLDAHKARVDNLLAPVVDIIPEPQPEEVKPNFLSEIVPAAARTSNATYGAYHDAMEAEHHDIDPSYKYSEHTDEIRKDVPSKYWDRFPVHRSLGAALKERKDILAELADLDTLKKAGFTGVVTSTALMLADVPTLLGGFSEAYALANFMTKTARVLNATTTGAIGLLTAVGQEAALQSTTHTRDGEDMIYAGVFSATVGPALGALSKQGKDLSKSIMRDMDEKLLRDTPMEYTSRAEAMDLAHAEVHGAAKPTVVEPTGVPPIVNQGLVLSFDTFMFKS